MCAFEYQGLKEFFSLGDCLCFLRLSGVDRFSLSCRNRYASLVFLFLVKRVSRRQGVKKTKENGGKSHFGKTLPFLRLTEKNQIVAIGTLKTTENHSGVG